MVAEPQTSALLQRRQFGRRDFARPGSAVVMGGSPVACIVANISEGGALLEFPGGGVPTRNFRLTIEGAPYTLVCEPKHQGGQSVGVNFVKPSDGVRLMAHLFPGSVVDPTTGDALRPARVNITAPLVTNRDLRRQVLSTIAERAAAEPPPAPQLSPLRRRLQILSNLTGLGRKKSDFTPPAPNQLPANVAAPIEHPATVLTAAGPASGDFAPPVAPFQPRRSRKKGIKGRSAGGIG
jgi:hypothetical protein